MAGSSVKSIAEPRLVVTQPSAMARTAACHATALDQAIFVSRERFRAIGGYPQIDLMEDIALSRQLKRLSPPLCLRDRVLTSSRRWERDGIVRTILLMWWLRLRYFLGADPAQLARIYQGRGARA